MEYDKDHIELCWTMFLVWLFCHKRIGGQYDGNDRYEMKKWL